MKSSEIFDNYAKIALEQGLISEAEDKTNPRYDTHDISAIEMLYGVKPNGKDEKHIMEQAHPNPAVVAPAHDKVNGLVENELERQDIMVGIARKPTTGNLGAKRYVQAKEDLLNEVVKIGFLLDRENQEDLMVLADQCGTKITKTAWAPLGIAAWKIVAALLAATAGSGAYLSYKGNHPNSQGFVADLDHALEEVLDALDMDGSTTWDIDDYPQLQATLQPLVSKLQKLKTLYNEFEAHRQDITRTLLQFKSESDINEKRKIIVQNAQNLTNSAKYDKIIKSMDTLMEVGRAVQDAIPDAAKEFMNARGKYEKNDSWWSGIKDLYYYAIQSDAEDAADALLVLAGSIPVLLDEVSQTKLKLDQVRSLNVPNIPDNKSQVEELMNGDAPKNQSDEDQSEPGKPTVQKQRQLPSWA